METVENERQPQLWRRSSRIPEHIELGSPLSRTKSSAGGFGEATGNAVDIDHAMQSYEEMRRELTKQSTIAADKEDLEKGVPGDQFDLTDYLSDIDRQQNEEGFQPKHLGIVVKDLTVMVNTSTFPHSMTQFPLPNKQIIKKRVLVRTPSGFLPT